VPRFHDSSHSRDLRDEADILAHALDIASAALTGERRSTATLIILSELVCEALDEIEQEAEVIPNAN
jgi:hypothetical protein